MIRFRGALPAFGLLARCGAIAIAERRFPLRARREAWTTHVRRNLALAASLWRFHHVHHLDRDMDTTTALRFHAGEIVLSVAWRELAIFAIGATPRDFEVWQRGLVASIVFHHANPSPTA